jgi:hypothetical protein
MDKAEIRRIFRRLWREKKLNFKGKRPGVSIRNLVDRSEVRNRKKKLEHFELWNEIYDEYLSWVLSVLTIQYAELKRRRSKGNWYQFHRAACALLFRIFSDLLAVRILCRADFDVAAKALTRSTVEYIDTLALLVQSPSIAAEFNKTNSNERSNAFWHKYLSKNKPRRLFLDAWRSRMGSEFDAERWDRWLYDFHGVLGMSLHPSFSGGVFSALTLRSLSKDNWPGFMGDRANISIDTFYHLIVHIWKVMLLFPDFPFHNRDSSRFGVRYVEKDELHRHVRIGGKVLLGFLPMIWDPKVNALFFHKIDSSDIFPRRGGRRNKKEKTSG